MFARRTSARHALRQLRSNRLLPTNQLHASASTRIEESREEEERKNTPVAEQKSIYPNSTASGRAHPSVAPLFNHLRLRENDYSGINRGQSSGPPSTLVVLLNNATSDPKLRELYKSLGAAVENQDAERAIKICDDIRTQKLSDGQRSVVFEPREQTVFFALLQVLSQRGLLKETRAVHTDMLRSGFKESVDSLNYLLKAAIVAGETDAIDDTLSSIAALPTVGFKQVDSSKTASAFSELLLNRSSPRPARASASFQLPNSVVRNWNSTTCAHLIDYANQTHNFEYALAVLSTCHRLGETLPTDSLCKLIGLCLHVFEFRIAAELAMLTEQGDLNYVSPDVGSASTSSVFDEAANPAASNVARKLPPPVWISILRACAYGGYLPGVELAWRRGVVEGLAAPDEGTINLILAMAGKEGSPQLVKHCLKQLDSTFDFDNLSFVSEHTIVPRSDQQPAFGRRLALQDWHFASLFEAYCTNRDFVAAMETLLSLKQRNIALTPAEVKRISTSIYPSTQYLDKAIAALYKLAHDTTKGTTMDIVNAVLNAAVWLRARDKALGIYHNIKTFHKAAGQGKEVKSRHRPTVETFNAMLSLCIDELDLELGKQILVDLNEERRQPDVITYERMIVLCLAQPTYEDAFRFIEEAKFKGLKPTRKTYEALVRKCYLSKDARWKRALAEMEEQEYVPSPRLLRFKDQPADLDSLENYPHLRQDANSDDLPSDEPLDDLRSVEGSDTGSRSYARNDFSF